MAEEAAGSKGSEEPKKFSKDGDGSLWNGPVKKRCCTDIICIPIFIAHILAFWALTFANFSSGDPYKLIKPQDFKGDFCGIVSANQWDGGSQPNMEAAPKMGWSMNLDETFSPIVQTLVCGQVGYSTLVSPGLASTAEHRLTEADFNLYCGISSAGAFDSALAAAGQLQNEVSSTISTYSDPTKAFKLFTSGGGAVGGSIMNEVTKYMNQVCVKTCAMGQNMTAPRSYTYVPSGNVMWGTDPSKRALGIWNKFIAEVNAAPGSAYLLDSFKFNAWPLADCPYPNAKNCVAMPGMTFTEVANWGTCVPKIDSGVVNIIGSAASSGYEAIATLSVTEDAKTAVFDGVGDVLKTFDVFIIVAVLSLVVGVLVLVLMRWVLAPFIWIGLFLIFIVFVAGGLALIVRSNQCADQTFVDSANSQKQSFANSANPAGTNSTGTNPFDVECPGGYSITSSGARDAAKYCGYFVMALGGVWLIGVVCMICRIRLAIAVNQVACMFLYSNPQVLFVPILQNVVGIIWIMVWCFCAAFLLSQVTTDAVPATSYATYAAAYGTVDTAGPCTNTWPAGGVYLDEYNVNCLTPADPSNPLCYKCSPPRFVINWKFGYSFFSFLWSNFFIVAVGQCTIAGAVGIWFFTPAGQKWKRATVMISLKNALMWHSGSLAFGSLILAIIVWVKWFLTFLSKQAKQNKNKVMEIIFKVLAYLVWCFEKCMKFLNKNAYIQIALMGTNFCTSAKAAFWLIARNLLRFGVIAILSHIVHFIAMVLICGVTALVGYFILGSMYSDVNPVAPTIFYVFIGWMTAKLFVGTFALSVDATLQCFIAAEEMDAGNDFAPEPLKKFIKEKEDSGEGSKAKAVDSCCCTIM